MAIIRRLGSSFTVRISIFSTAIVCFITKALRYKASLNQKLNFIHCYVCISDISIDCVVSHPGLATGIVSVH